MMGNDCKSTKTYSHEIFIKIFNICEIILIIIQLIMS
jgi:hypothetical protein